MSPAAERRPSAADPRVREGDSAGRRSGVALFLEALRKQPLRTGGGLPIEYGMFASGLGLAAALFATRVPLRLIDGVTGWKLRERFIDLLARVSPG